MTNVAFDESRAGLDEELDYRPVSALAVAGLICGLLSAAAFVGKLFWPLGMAGVVLNIAALRRVASPPPRQGRRLALVGLVTSLFFLGLAVAHETSFDWLRKSQARRVADTWVEAVMSEEPDLPLAHQLTLSLNQREHDTSRIAALYKNSPYLTDAIARFREIDIVQKLLELGKQGGQLVCDAVELQSDGDFEATVACQYSVTYEDAGQPDSYAFTIRLTRPKDLGQHVAGWQVLVQSPRPIAVPLGAPPQ